MKREYKTPVVKMIDLATESPLLDSSITDPTTTTPGVGDEGEYSNRRRNSIWGDEY